MSFASKPTRPDSRDTAKLRAEYEAKARQFHESSDPGSRTKLRDDKAKAFEKVKQNMIGERRQDIAGLQRVLAMQGKFKTKEQMKKERDAALAAAGRE